MNWWGCHKLYTDWLRGITGYSIHKILFYFYRFRGFLIGCVIISERFENYLIFSDVFCSEIWDKIWVYRHSYLGFQFLKWSVLITVSNLISFGCRLLLLRIDLFGLLNFTSKVLKVFKRLLHNLVYFLVWKRCGWGGCRSEYEMHLNV